MPSANRRESPRSIEYRHGVADVTANVAHVRERIAAAAGRSGRRPEEITLVAVAKGVGLSRIQEAVACGVTDLGENRVQEATPKVTALGRGVVRPGPPQLRWHMVGHLQRNKVRQAVSIFDAVHSVDSERLATELSQRAHRSLDVLLQVNVAGEPRKFGVSPEAAARVLRGIVGLPNLRIIGLMTIAPQVDDPEKVRPIFRRLRLLRDEFERQRIAGLTLAELSMGMTDDFEVAIEEGATMVRIGRAVFGKRQN